MLKDGVYMYIYIYIYDKSKEITNEVQGKMICEGKEKVSMK